MVEFWRTSVENVTACFPTLNNILTELGSQISVYSDKMVQYELYKLNVKDWLPLEV
jgi:hypothetical protein